MKLYHNSWDTQYRKPFGAVQTGTTVTLRLDISDIPDLKNDNLNVSVRVWVNDTETLYPMSCVSEISNNISNETSISYTASITIPDKPCLFWYTFIVDYQGTQYKYVNINKTGGKGKIIVDGEASSYQITVYDKNFKTPKWFCGKIMYQIFPDRFFGVHDNGHIEKSRDEYIIHYNRYEDISFNSHPYENGPACNDFYGGNLKGIIQKLPYIKSLGVGVIYLNPIFEAYSNHKYDTANYKRIDPMFGTEEDFSMLCSEAEKLNIKIILDGVFSHTGADSIYFNKYGYYGDNGAYNHPESPYRTWYDFGDDNSYQSWWGCSNLPNVNEMSDSYLDYILRDDDSVIKKWLRLGASGWRLDVADELPDEFIKILRTEVKSVKPDAVIIGEVWEDASNKTAYSKQREYLLGYELDSVMNYPFKDSVSSYIMGRKKAEDLASIFMSVKENYPTDVFYSLMNLLGTHDTMRIKSFFGGLDSDCGYTRLESGMEDLAVYRFMCAVFMQMTMPGVPSIYYGDEVGMQGGRDPFNRQPFPWRGSDMDTLHKVQNLGAIRNSSPVLQYGFADILTAEDDVFVYLRSFKDNKNVFGETENTKYCPVICGVNRGFEEKTVTLNITDNILPNINSSEQTVSFKTLTDSSGRKSPAKLCESSLNSLCIELTIPPVGYTAVEVVKN